MKQHTAESTPENSSRGVWRVKASRVMCSGCPSYACLGCLYSCDNTVQITEGRSLWLDEDLWVHSLANRVCAKVQPLVIAQQGTLVRWTTVTEGLALQYHPPSKSFWGIQKWKQWGPPSLTQSLFLLLSFLLSLGWAWPFPFVKVPA